ncbi:MAG: urease accessory protein UreD [Pseudomonadota bacterium]
MAAAAGCEGWQAELKLRFARTPSRTVLAAQRHQGPLRVQRMFYPESGGVCHAYILHPPGGVVAGDNLTLEAEMGARAQTLFTTPAATKFYRSTGRMACARQRLAVAAGAELEWFPQENIIFHGARAELVTRVELAADSAFMGWEILCLGRPAAHERFSAGACRQSFEIWREGRAVWMERAHYGGDSPVLLAKWGMAAQPVAASFVCVAWRPDLIGALRKLADAHGAASCSVTQLDEVIAARYLGPCAEAAKHYFMQVWTILRPEMLGRAACAPRIWRT